MNYQIQLVSETRLSSLTLTSVFCHWLTGSLLFFRYISTAPPGWLGGQLIPVQCTHLSCIISYNPLAFYHSLPHSKELGVQIDEKLSWDSHIDMICKKVSAGIGAMRRIKLFVLLDMLKKVYKSLVQPYFECCPPLWDNCGKLLKDKLQRFQSRAARVLPGANYDIRSADIIQTLSWDILDARRLRTKSTLMYKILYDDTHPTLGTPLLDGMLIRLITISEIVLQI